MNRKFPARLNMGAIDKYSAVFRKTDAAVAPNDITINKMLLN